MLRYVMRRLLTAIPTLFVIVTISFFLMRVAPGGPFNQEKGLNPVIKANLERVYPIVLGAAGRDDDDRRADALTSCLFDHLPAVEAGEHEIDPYKD